VNSPGLSPKKVAVALVLLAWVGLVVGGFCLLMRYESKAAAPGKVSGTNGHFNNSNQPTLVLGLHPHCPCSKATVAELNKILGHAPGKRELVAYVFKPKDEAPDWIESATVSSLKKLSVRVELDNDGCMARQLGLSASGQIQFYSAKGELLYDGGITSARGHQGDNVGAQTVIDLLQKGGSSRKSAPVFGCPIFESNSP